MLETLEMLNFNPGVQGYLGPGYQVSRVNLPHPTEVSGPKKVIKPQLAYLGIHQFWGPRRLT